MLQRTPLAGFSNTTAFTRDYVLSFDRVASFFHYNPHLPTSMATRLEFLDSCLWPDMSSSAELVEAQQHRWGADASSIAAARSLGSANTYMVVSGQQPGLFGGPAYSQLKAISTITLARELEKQHPGRSFVPVFWIASADSDFDEVSRTAVVGVAQDFHRLLLRPDKAQDGRMLNRREIDYSRLSELIDNLESSTLPHGLYRADVVTALRDAYSPESGRIGGELVSGFARWMLRLFRGSGLVVLEPEEVIAQRQDIGAIYAQQLLHARRYWDILDSRGAELQSAGYGLQVEIFPDDTHVFRVDDFGYRDKLLSVGTNELQGKRSGNSWAAAELAELARRHPDRFTGNVLLRPVVEDALFPCAAWIGGSAELAYRAQSSALFELHGRKHAPAYLRHHGTFLPQALARTLHDTGYDLSSLPTNQQAWRSIVAEQHLQSPELNELLSKLASANEQMDELIARIPSYLPELARSMQSKIANSNWLHRRVTRKVNSALLRNQTDKARGLLAAQALAYPMGKPQDRLLNLLSFLPRIGIDGLSHLLGELDMPCWDHCTIIFD
jgi:bacillithiol biosynthesis cysteine-adding enzyme BshC